MLRPHITRVTCTGGKNAFCNIYESLVTYRFKHSYKILDNFQHFKRKMCCYHRIRPLRQRPILPHVLVMDYKACYRLKCCPELLLSLIEWPNFTFIWQSEYENNDICIYSPGNVSEFVLICIALGNYLVNWTHKLVFKSDHIIKQLL